MSVKQKQTILRLKTKLLDALDRKQQIFQEIKDLREQIRLYNKENKTDKQIKSIYKAISVNPYNKKKTEEKKT